LKFGSDERAYKYPVKIYTTLTDDPQTFTACYQEVTHPNRLSQFAEGKSTKDQSKTKQLLIQVDLSQKSGHPLNGEAQTIMDRGCSGFLQKPFQLSKLSSKVKEMLGR
jgi:hypothetical protein